MLANGDIVKSDINGNVNDPNSNMVSWVKTNVASQIIDGSGLNQQEINNKRTINLDSIADFNASPVLLNAIYTTKSYIAGGNNGAWVYKYSGTIPKSKHNGGTIIDPSIVFDTITNYLSPKTTSGYGCYIALNVEREIPAEIFGANPVPENTKNDVSINAAISAASALSVAEPSKTVTIGAGEFLTENAIVNTSLWHIVPPHIKGSGRESTKILKVTSSQLGAGYLAPSDTDAVLVSSPRSDNVEGASAYLISESVSGLSLKRQTETSTSVGWYRHRSAMGYVDDIYSETHHTHFIFNDCWMTNFGQLWAHGGTHGYIFNVATSLRGGWLYATSTRGRAFLFDKVIYSDIKCCADHCGLDGDTGATAYRFIDCKGVSGKFNAENHRGELFSISGGYGISISGQDWRAKAVATSVVVPRIYTTYTTVKFIGYDFLESTAALTDAERANYSFLSKDSVSVVDFDCSPLPQKPYLGDGKKTPFISLLDGNKFNAKLTLADFIQNGRHVQHVLALTTSYKKLCYVAQSGRFKLNSANSLDANQPYFAYVALELNRHVGIKVNSISTNQASPTELATIYIDDNMNPTYSTKLHGYVDEQGWLNVKAAGSGYSLSYAFDITI